MNNMYNNRRNFKDERKIEDKYIEYFKRNILNIDVENYDTFIDNEKAYANILKNNGMTTSQIRNIYSEILKTKKIIELKRLRPKFAYIAGRNKKPAEKFMDLLDYVVKSMDDKKDENEQIKNFKSFLEAIVAYMKYFGDKN